MNRRTWVIIFILCFVGITVFFMLRPTRQSLDNPTFQSRQARQPSFVVPISKTQNHSDQVWVNWIDAQIDLMIDEIFKRFREELPYVGPPEEAIDVDDVRQQLRKFFESKADELKKK
ncbi:hypothetical protein C6497_10420 [Candidatus Poribacteria bacterium]|nr:MAG: hypothetical protein C6497_10420 [Candidatus Poribacteria bacterium]